MDVDKMIVETCMAPINIALIKYWGKRDEDLILPVNDSLSMTLCTDKIATITTVCARADFESNRMWLNGEEVEFEQNQRLQKCLTAVRQLAEKKGRTSFPLTWKLHISSKNNFATAAGLASSAAGYACLVYTLAHLYNVGDEELTAIARLGSGSACRSLYGGFVQWHKGTLDDGTDSIATPLFKAEHWPDMHVLIVVVSEERKKISSTAGMQRSVQTSQLLQHRIEHCVIPRIKAISEAIRHKDFETFAKIIMQDSNQFHAIALDTYPPCVYMNDVSHAICNFVHAYNSVAGSLKVAYTFDAGPNACLFLLEENVAPVLSALKRSFPIQADNLEITSTKEIDEQNKYTSLPVYETNLIKEIKHTKIGYGPKRLDSKASLIDLNTGLPHSIPN